MDSQSSSVRISKDGQSSSAGANANEETELGIGNATKSKVEIAHEFRQDAFLSPVKFLKYFRCCVCGSPSGKDAFCCKVKGHPVCTLCRSELQITECPYVDVRSHRTCKSLLYQFSSKFREMIFDKTIVSCVNHYKGCGEVGIWNEIQKHQSTCDFALHDL